MSERKVRVGGKELTPVPRSGKCRACGHPGDFHQCCRCGKSATGLEEVDHLFGWRAAGPEENRVAKSQSQCKECRNRSSIENKRRKLGVPPVVQTPIVSVPHDISSPVVKPIDPTVAFEGDLKPFSFGALSVSPNELNTTEGAMMVPSVDENYNFAGDEAIVLANMIENGENTWVWGPSGVGKTSGVRQICALLNRPLYRLNMSGDVSVDDLVGSTHVEIDPRTGKAITTFSYGVLIRAMLNGGVLLIDEITSAPPHILIALQAVTEPSDNVHELWADGRPHSTYLCTANRGETIHAAQGFRIVVTDNTNGQGDVSGLYAGTNTMNEAFRSRFSQWLYKRMPDVQSWRHMLTSKAAAPANVAKAIVRVAVDVNKGSSQFGATKVTNSLAINPRDTLAIARLFRTYGDLKIAFQVGMLNSISPTDPDFVFLSDLVKNICGGVR